MSYKVEINWDEEASVWYAVCDEIPLAIGSNSLVNLLRRIKIVAKEIIVLNN